MPHCFQLSIRRFTSLLVAMGTFALPATLSTATLLAFTPAVAQAQTGQKWALLIGIDAYEDRNTIAGLSAAAADARAIKKTLVEAAGFAEDHVTLLVSDGDVKPSRTNIYKALGALARNAKPGDTVFVLYAGHGIEVEGKPYLLPYDASADSDDTITRTGLEASDFRALLRNVKARAVVVALDMCRTDPRKQGTRDAISEDNKLGKPTARALDFSQARPVAPVTGAEAPTVFVTLYSCSPEERAYEWADKGRGYFSYFLEQGLRGKAADSTGKVTIDGLSGYLSREVAGAVKIGVGKPQRPYPSLDGPGAGSFVLSTARPSTAPVVRPTVTSIDTRATLMVKVNTPGAVIAVDGKPVGANGVYTENLLDEESRNVKVKITAPGYEGQLKSVTLVRGKNPPLDVKLEEIAAAPTTAPEAPVVPTTAMTGKTLFAPTMKAHGGDAYLQLRSLTFKGNGTFWQQDTGTEIPLTSVTFQCDGADRTRISMDTLAGPIISASPGGGKKGWMQAGGMIQDISEEEDSPNPLFLISAVSRGTAGYKVDSLPSTSPEVMSEDGKPTKGFIVTTPQGKVTRIYIEAETGLLCRAETKTPTGTFALSFGSFQRTQGVTLPTWFRFSVKSSEETSFIDSMTFRLEQVEINPMLPTSLFQRPRD